MTEFKAYVKMVEDQFKVLANAAMQYAIDLPPGERNDEEADKIFESYDVMRRCISRHVMRDVTIKHLKSINPDYNPSKHIPARPDYAHGKSR